MIYPTRLSVLAAAAGAPAAVLVALVWPGRWQAALAWPLTVLGLTLLDALRAALAGGLETEVTIPGEAHVGQALTIGLCLRFARHAPGRVQVALETNPLLAIEGDDRPWVLLGPHGGEADFTGRTQRRGMARIERLWLRWRGGLGLAWVQRGLMLARTVPVLPDTLPVAGQGAHLLRRATTQGLINQPIRGAGGEFDALAEFHPGMDRRAIDWKHSARHAKLLAREYEAEQNAHIVFAIDCGRQMCEPVAGLPRLDRIVTAVLVNCWVALRLGDKVALHAFDSRPRIASGLVSGRRAFGELRDLATRIDYSSDETNHTLGLASLSSRLARRSLIVLFTEFADVVSAELMLRGAARLVETHLLLVVVLRDEELETLRDRSPEDADDVTRAVTAAGLLRERMVVLTRLRHLGAQVIEAEHDHVGERIAAAYVALKQRNLL